MLTQREIEVLKLVCLGYTNDEIAESLIISSHTAKAHVCSILRKVGVNNRTFLAYKAAKDGLVDFDS